MVVPKVVPPIRQPLSLGGWISWLTITFAVLGLSGMILLTQLWDDPESKGDASSTDLLQVQIGAKSLIAQNNLDRVLAGSPPSNLGVDSSLDSGCYEQRLCYTILRNEIEGPETALADLENLDQLVTKHDFEPTETQQRLRDVLSDLFVQYSGGDFDAGTLPIEERDLIEKRLGYCGKLVLLPDGTPNKKQRDELITDSVYRIMGAGISVILGGLAMVVGVGVAVFYFFMGATGNLNLRFAASKTNHNVYVETFAIWLVLFFGSSLLIGSFVTNMSTQMLVQPIVFFGSLGCLIWPVFRGIPIGQMLQDIGWRSRQPVVDTFVTPFTYLSTLPLLIPGFVFLLISAVVMSSFQKTSEFSREAGPGHPIQEYISEGNLTVIFLVFLTACVAAPVVEETMFRGVLYRHLRDWTSTSARWFSVAFSSVLNGFIFAAIHPQGVVAIPLLMSLAIGFSLAREWRGSLLTCIAMHALHNTLITCVSLLIL